MPGKASEGFTKSAQNAKFIRHRDCKLKDGEQKKEDHIARVMCEGVCRRCREKSQWRFKYDKYKPLKKPASCSVCKNKTITKAYRTMCDACASKAKKCSSCCVLLAEAHKADAALEAALDAVLQSRGGDDEDEEEEDETEFGCVIQSLEDTSISSPPVKVASSSSAIKSVSKATEGSDDEDEEEEEVEANDENADEDEEGSEWEDADEEEDEEEGEEGEGDDQDSDGEEISDDENEGDDTFTVEETPVTVFGLPTKNKFITTTSTSDNISVASEVSINAEIKLMDVMWDERKFNNMAASKYSKNRVVGKEEGQIY